MKDYEQAAAYLGVSPRAVRRFVAEKRIRFYKVGKFVRFKDADLDAFIEAGRVDPESHVVTTLTHLRRRSAG